jgi:protein gp37
MSENTAIEWTDATVNFWWGCTKVGPGCDHCYAETWDKRTGGAHWGTGVARRGIKGAEATMRRLNRKSPGARVFCQSMSDLFDSEVPKLWFLHAWDTILDCTNLQIQLVTKRLPMVEKRLAEFAEAFRDRSAWPQHAGLMITVCNQAEADRDIPRLLALKAKLGIPWVGLSVEPMLGPVDLTNLSRPAGAGVHEYSALECDVDPEDDDEWRGATIGWVICGGESGPHARPMHPDWARSLRDQCVAAGVPFFFKHWGEWGPSTPEEAAGNPRSGWRCLAAHPHVPKAAELHPEAGAAFIEHKGKKAAGRLLDGREWNQFPGVAND